MEINAKNATHNLTEDEKTSFRLWLQRQFTERCKKNARYSLRAFAKNVQLDPSSVSQILNGKRPISKNLVRRICDKLSATPKELKQFGLIRDLDNNDVKFMQVEIDTFAVISDWYHYAILELTFVSGFKADPKWISKKLSITVAEASSAIERLKRLQLLIEEDGSLIKSSKYLTNSSSISTSAAHKELQRQLIQKSLIAVDECTQEEKDITSITMAVDEYNLGRARELTRKFRRDICQLLENGEQTRVYNLAIQLYPISNNTK